MNRGRGVRKQDGKISGTEKDECYVPKTYRKKIASQGKVISCVIHCQEVLNMKIKNGSQNFGLTIMRSHTSSSALFS